MRGMANSLQGIYEVEVAELMPIFGSMSRRSSKKKQNTDRLLFDLALTLLH